MSFLPSDYSTPSTSSLYLKPSDIEKSLKIRIISSPIFFWQNWNQETNKPVRVSYVVGEPAPTEVHLNKKGEVQKWSFNWAMVCYDYIDESCKIISIYQKGILSNLQAFSEDENIGSPTDYDIVIQRTGEDLETRYTVVPLMKPENMKPLAKEILDQAKTIDLRKLLTNDDPFANMLIKTPSKSKEDINIEDVPF